MLSLPYTKRCALLLALIIVLAAPAAPSGLVLCLGHGGHAAVEAPHASACHAADSGGMPVEHHDENPADVVFDHGRKCVDIPLFASQSNALPAKAKSCVSQRPTLSAVMSSPGSLCADRALVGLPRHHALAAHSATILRSTILLI